MPPPEEDPVLDFVHGDDDDDKPSERDTNGLWEPDPDAERNRLPSLGDRVESPSATDGPAPQQEAAPETLLDDPADGIEEGAATQQEEDSQQPETLLYDP